MKALVASYRHHMLPLAWRLRREGWDVELSVVRDRYRKAWSGLLEPKRIDEIADASERVLVTDSTLAQEKLAGVAPAVFGLQWGECRSIEGSHPVRFAAWSTGEGLTAYHAWFPDMGAGAGGLGARCVSGGVLSAHASVAGLARSSLGPHADEIKASGHRGLVWLDESGKLAGGWEFPHAHLFVGEQPLGTLIAPDSEPTLPEWTCGVSVSVPPWPLECNAAPAPSELAGWTDDDRRSAWFFDIAVDQTSRSIRVGGCDGLVALVRGSGITPDLARARAIAVVSKLVLPEAQVRIDIGARLNGVLHSLGV